MWTDANGETHYEFWDGVRFNGKCHNNVPLFWLCQEFGTNVVEQVCRETDTSPEEYNLTAIRKGCIEQENSYV